MDKDKKDKKICSFPLVHYERNLWALLDGTWRNIDEMFKSEKRMDDAMSLRIKKRTKEETGEIIENKSAVEYWRWAKAGASNNLDTRQHIGIVFKNGFVNKIGNFTKFEKRVPFTTTQIPVDYEEDKELDPIFSKYLDKISGGDKEWQEKLLMLLATCLINKNYAVIALFFGVQGCGKSYLIDLMKAGIGENNYAQIDPNQVFGENSSIFAMRDADNKIMINFSETPKSFSKTASEKLKKFADKGTQPIDIKGSNKSKFNNIATYLLDSNNLPTIYEPDNAIKERFVVFEFKNTRNDLEFVEWSYLQNNQLEVFKSLLPTLVKHYNLLRTKKSPRAIKFRVKSDTDKLWNIFKSINSVRLWLEEGFQTKDGYQTYQERWSGSTLAKIWTEFYNTTVGRTSNIKTIQSFSKQLRELGWEKKQKQENGTRKTLWFCPEKEVENGKDGN